MQRDNAFEVVLHIGGAKCGSSAIQAFLQQNVAALAELGIAVPGTTLDFTSEVTGEQIWAFEKSASEGADYQGLVARLSDLMNEARHRGHRKLVISAENICNHAALAGVVREGLGDVATRVILYVRRQDDFLISSWQQWHLKLFDSVEAFLADRVGRVACWNSMILPWAEAFGDDRITVRPFVRGSLKGGDVVEDFCASAGISGEGLSPLKRAANPSFDEALARLAHRVRDVFEDQHDNRFYEVMVRLIGSEALKKRSASSLLSLETRRRIMARYSDENDALRERFLPEHGDRPLFRAPNEEDVAEVSEQEKLTQDIAMLTRAVYALACEREAGR